jgi:predicted MFS family arabinose efflux permease
MKVSGIKEVIYQSATVLVLIATGLFLEGQHVLDYKLTILMYIFAFMMIFFMKETKIPHESKNLKFRERMNNHFIKTWKVVTSSKRLMFLIVMGTLLFAPVTSLFIWAQEYFLYNGFSEEWMLYFLAFHSLTAAIGGFLASKIEKKFGEKKLLLALPILFSTCFFLTLIPYYGFIGFIIIGFLDSLFYVVLFDYINRLIPSETRASVLSFFGMCFSIVMIITFPVMGLIGTLTNIWYAYLFISIVVLIVSLLMIKTILKNNISENI